MKYAQLLAHLQKLTPEQLAHKVTWCGEERGGEVLGIEILREAQCNPSGDGWEPYSDLIRTEMEGGQTEEQARAFADSEIVAPAGLPILLVDAPSEHMEPNE